MTLHPVDWVIFVCVLVVTMAIGIYHACTGGKQKTTQEYLTANRKLHFFPTSLSLTASFFSAILIVGQPAEGYLYGGIFWLFSVGLAISCVISALIFVPVFHPLKLTSVNYYLKLRFDSRFVQVLGTLSSIASMLLYTATAYFAPATGINALTGFPTWASIIILSFITIVYTSIGGIKAVIWTDVFQAVIIVAGLITISARAIGIVGGISEVWEICQDWGRLHLANFDPSITTRLTFWTLILGGPFYNLEKFGPSQTAVQRYCSMHSLRDARLTVLGVIPWAVMWCFLAVLSGITTFAFYTKIGCDPLKGGFLKNANQLIPHFVADTLSYPGVQGMLLASLVATSLSTASSTLNSSAANIWEDVLRVIWPNLPEKRNVLITKLLVIAFGIVSTALAFGVKELGGTVIQMVVTFKSACGGPTMALFLLGMFVPFINWVGAAAGGFAGFTFAMWVGFGGYSIKRYKVTLPTTIANCSAYAAAYNHPLPAAKTIVAAAIGPEKHPLQDFYSMSYLWIAPFAMSIVIVVAIVVSLLTRSCVKREGKVPGNLLHPWMRNCYPGGPDVVIPGCKDKEDKDMVKVKPNGAQPIENGDYPHGVYDRPISVTKF